MTKKTFTLIACSIVLAMTYFTINAKAATPIEKFFRPAPDIAKNLDPDLLYPRGRLFPFSLYSVQHRDLANLKADGFTMIGPYYGNLKDFREGHKGILEYSKIAGLKCAYGIGWKGHTAYERTEQQIIEGITKQVNAVKDNTNIGWWSVRPEELRWWRANEKKYLQLVYKTIKALDPLARPVFMYEPQNRDAEGLTKTLEFQDVCAKGMYVNLNKKMFERSWLRWGLVQQIQAVQNFTPASKFAIVVPEMNIDQPLEHAHMIADWCRHDSYLGFIMGAKGFISWSGYRNRKGFEKHFQAYYDGYANVAKELTGQMGLGQIFLFGQKRNDMKITVKAGPKILTGQAFDKPYSYPSVAFLDTAYGTDRYLFIVNSANDPVTVNIHGLPAETIQKKDIFKGSDFTKLSGGSFEITLNPLQVKGFLFAPAPYKK